MREDNAMIRLLWAASVRTRHFLRRYMPTNILLGLIRTRRGLKWGIPAMLLAVPYLLAASTCTTFISDGAPGWLNLLVLLFIYDAMKFIIMGLVSVVLLAAAQIRKRRTRQGRYWLRSPTGGSTGGQVAVDH